MSKEQNRSAFAISPAKSRYILNSIPTVIYVLSVTPKGFSSQWVSDSVKRILGYDIEEAMAPDWWIDCLHPEDKKAAVEQTSVLMSRGHLVQEYRFRCKDGRYLWMQDEASLLRAPDGRPKEIVGFWTSVTDRKLAQERVAQASGQGVGLTEEELTRSNNRIALQLLIAALIIGSLFLLLASRGPLLFGGLSIIGLTGVALGIILGLVMIWRVRSSDRRFSHILNSIPTVIYELAVTANNFRSQWVSDSVKRILNYEVEEAMAPNWWVHCLHPDDKEAAIKKTSILLSEGHLVQEYRFRSKGGDYLWILDEASLMRGPDGRPKEIIGFWTDITDRKIAEARIAQARKLERERARLIGSSDRNLAAGAMIAGLIIGSSFLWGATTGGLTAFVASGAAGVMLLGLLIRSGKY